MILTVKAADSAVLRDRSALITKADSAVRRAGLAVQGKRAVDLREDLAVQIVSAERGTVMAQTGLTGSGRTGNVIIQKKNDYFIFLLSFVSFS